MVLPAFRLTDRIVGTVMRYLPSALSRMQFLRPYKFLIYVPAFLPFWAGPTIGFVLPKWGSTTQHVARRRTVPLSTLLSYSSKHLRLVCQECANLRNALKFCSLDTSSSWNTGPTVVLFNASSISDLSSAYSLHSQRA